MSDVSKMHVLHIWRGGSAYGTGYLWLGCLGSGYPCRPSRSTYIPYGGMLSQLPIRRSHDGSTPRSRGHPHQVHSADMLTTFLLSYAWQLKHPNLLSRPSAPWGHMGVLRRFSPEMPWVVQGSTGLRLPPRGPQPFPSLHLAYGNRGLGGPGEPQRRGVQAPPGCGAHRQQGARCPRGPGSQLQRPVEHPQSGVTFARSRSRISAPVAPTHAVGP